MFLEYVNSYPSSFFYMHCTVHTQDNFNDDAYIHEINCMWFEFGNEVKVE